MLQLRKISGTSVKIISKGDRDGKKKQKGVQQEAAYSAVVLNDHMYPRPYIVYDPKGII